MELKLIFLLATIFINDIHGWPFIPWAWTVDQKVNVALGSISSTIHETNLQINTANNSIQSQIKNAQTTLTTELNQLNNVIAQAQTEVKQTGKNIQPCLDQKDFDLAAVNLTKLEACNASVQLDQIGSLVGKLGYLEGTIFRNIKGCLFVSTANCTDSILENIDNQVKAVQENAVTQLSNVQETSADCVQQNMAEQDETVNRAADNFKSCYQNL